MKKILSTLAVAVVSTLTIAQSDNCATATAINLTNGSACVNGTTVNATSSNTLYGGCNAAPANEVWYTYVTTGSQNDFVINPGTMTNAEIVVYTVSCNGLLEFCDAVVGGASINQSWGIPPGTQVWIGVMSNGGNQGTFELCVDSYTPPPGGGNACGGAIPVCSGVTTVDMNPLTSSAVQPSCFGGAVNQDVWFTFDVLASGTFEWSATPSGASTGVELDWALFDITGGCPGVEVDCNYNYDFGNNGANGQTPGGTGEFNPPSNLIAGNTYAIVVDFFSSGTVGSLDFSVDGGTAQIAPNADFTINPAGPTCGPSVNVTINDNSVGAPDWDFGDGSPIFTGNNPPPHNYSTPGVYAITASFGGACPSVHTEFVELYGPVVVVPNSTDETCPGDCDGTADVQPTGGSGQYSYVWNPGGMTTPSVTGLCNGAYTVTVTDAICGAAPPANVNINSGFCACSIDNFTANVGACIAGPDTYTTTGTVQFTNPPLTGQLIVEDCYGNQDVMNAPFVSPFNYTITGQTADGAPCDVTVYFTDDLGCTNTINYNAPLCPCNIDNFNVNIGLCDQLTDTYCVDGDVFFTSPPGSGQLVVEVDNGTTIYDTLINMPFNSGQTWSICGIPSNGAASTVTVYFSSDPGCSSTINFNAPTSCACSADIGTFSTNITGASTNNYVLCFGDQIDLMSNGDWTGPGEMFNPPGPPYNPGVSWLIYSCPPTVAVTPDPNNTVPSDPCFLGLASNTTLTDINNGGSWMDAFPAGTFTNNTVYFVPITMYDQGGGTYSYVNGTIPCYEMGPAFAVQYLNQYTFSFTEDCLAGTADITVNGGLPSVDGSNFTASNLVPGTASFVNTTAPDGGVIQLSGLTGGDIWSFDVTDDNGCPYTANGGPFPPLEDPGFNYAQTSWCTAEPPMNPTITGTGGGTFTSAPPGLTINGASGQITPATSTPGTYTVTYTTPGACFDDSTITVNIASTPMVNPIADQTICDGTNFTDIIFTGSAGTSFDWTNDNTNIGLAASGTGDILAFTGTAPTVQEVAQITVTPTAGTCVGPIETFTLTVDPQDDASFTYPAPGWCTNDVVQSPNITGTAGGMFTSNPAGLTINAATGDITPASSTPGVYTVTYTTPGPCVATQDVQVEIYEVPSVDPVVNQTVCEGDNFADIIFTGPTAGTTFDWVNDNANTGLALNGQGDILAFAGQTSGGTEVSNITVTPSTVNCTGATTNFSLTVNPLDDPSYNYPGGLTYCQTGTDPVANITGTPGGTFSYVATSGGPTLDINTATGDITLLSSNLGTYDITYTTNGLCPQSSTLTLTITDAPIADFTLGIYCANDADPMPTFINGGSGGTFSSTPGLTINAGTGLVDLDGSTPGVYTVTNTINVPGCAVATYDDDITIFEIPDANIVGSATICPNDPLPNVDINITAGAANWDVTYEFNGTPTTVNAAASPYTINSAAVGTYDLISITDANGCTNALVGQVVIDTYPTPVVDPMANQSVCEGDDLLVTAFSGSPAGNTYDWVNLTGTDVGFGLNGTGDIGNFTGVNGTGLPIPVTIEVTPTSADGCVGAPETFVITVNPLPVVAFDGGPLTGCEPLIVTFNNLTNPPGAFCEWSFGDGNVQFGCGSVSNTYMNAGLYDVSLTVTSQEGCQATTTYNSYVEVFEQPIASFSYSPNADITIEDTEVEFTNTSVNANTYTWDFGDGSPISNVESLPHLFPNETPGEYLVTLWAYNGVCYDSTQALIHIDDVIIFYVPNVMTPDGDEFNEMFIPIFTSGYDPFDYHLTIFNRWGEIIFESYNAEKGWNGHYGDGGLVQDGVYVWQIEFKESMSDRRHTHRGHVTVLK